MEDWALGTDGGLYNQLLWGTVQFSQIEDQAANKAGGLGSWLQWTTGLSKMEGWTVGTDIRLDSWKNWRTVQLASMKKSKVGTNGGLDSWYSWRKQQLERLAD